MFRSVKHKIRGSFGEFSYMRRKFSTLQVQNRIALTLSVELANIFSTSSLQHNWLVCIETQFSIGFFQIYFNFVLPGSHKIILKMTCFYYEVQNRFGQPSANPPLEKILKPVGFHFMLQVWLVLILDIPTLRLLQ